MHELTFIIHWYYPVKVGLSIYNIQTKKKVKIFKNGCCARDDVVYQGSQHTQIFKISHRGAILVRLSRFHTPDFFFSNVGFHVLANLDFSLSPFLTTTSEAGISLFFSPISTAPKIVGDFAVFLPISTPGFVGWWQRWMDPAITSSSC